MDLIKDVLELNVDNTYFKYRRAQFINDIFSEYGHFLSWHHIKEEYQKYYLYLAYYREYLSHENNVDICEDDLGWINIFARKYVASLAEFMPMTEEEYELSVTEIVEIILKLLTYERYGFKDLISRDLCLREKTFNIKSKQLKKHFANQK